MNFNSCGAQPVVLYGTMFDYDYSARSRRLDQGLGDLTSGERSDLVPDLPFRHGVHEVSLKHPTLGYPRTPGRGRFIALMYRQGLRDEA